MKHVYETLATLQEALNGQGHYSRGLTWRFQAHKNQIAQLFLVANETIKQSLEEDQKSVLDEWARSRKRPSSRAAIRDIAQFIVHTIDLGDPAEPAWIINDNIHPDKKSCVELEILGFFSQLTFPLDYLITLPEQKNISLGNLLAEYCVTRCYNFFKQNPSEISVSTYLKILYFFEHLDYEASVSLNQSVQNVISLIFVYLLQEKNSLDFKIMVKLLRYNAIHGLTMSGLCIPEIDWSVTLSILTKISEEIDNQKPEIELHQIRQLFQIYDANYENKQDFPKNLYSLMQSYVPQLNDTCESLLEKRIEKELLNVLQKLRGGGFDDILDRIQIKKNHAIKEIGLIPDISIEDTLSGVRLIIEVDGTIYHYWPRENGENVPTRRTLARDYCIKNTGHYLLKIPSNYNGDYSQLLEEAILKQYIGPITDLRQKALFQNAQEMKDGVAQLKEYYEKVKLKINQYKNDLETIANQNYSTEITNEVNEKHALLCLIDMSFENIDLFFSEIHHLFNNVDSLEDILNKMKSIAKEIKASSDEINSLGTRGLLEYSLFNDQLNQKAIDSVKITGHLSKQLQHNKAGIKTIEQIQTKIKIIKERVKEINSSFDVKMADYLFSLAERIKFNQQADNNTCVPGENLNLGIVKDELKYEYSPNVEFDESIPEYNFELKLTDLNVFEGQIFSLQNENAGQRSTQPETSNCWAKCGELHNILAGSSLSHAAPSKKTIHDNADFNDLNQLKNKMKQSVVDLNSRVKALQANGHQISLKDWWAISDRITRINDIESANKLQQILSENTKYINSVTYEPIRNEYEQKIERLKEQFKKLDLVLHSRFDVILQELRTASENGDFISIASFLEEQNNLMNNAHFIMQKESLLGRIDNLINYCLENHIELSKINIIQEKISQATSQQAINALQRDVDDCESLSIQNDKNLVLQSLVPYYYTHQDLYESISQSHLIDDFLYFKSQAYSVLYPNYYYSHHYSPTFYAQSPQPRYFNQSQTEDHQQKQTMKK